MESGMKNRTTNRRSCALMSMVALAIGTFVSGAALAQTQGGNASTEQSSASSAKGSNESSPTAARAEPAELPAAAQGPSVPQEKGYLVKEIQSGLYWVTDGVYQTMFLTTGKGVIAVDAPPTLGEKYLQAIREVTDEPVTHVVYSHQHADHIGAAHLFPKTAKIIAHEQTAGMLRELKDPNRPVPDTVFDKRHVLNHGNQVLHLEYHGNNHEPGNIFIHAPKQKVLMLVDIVFPGWVPFKNLAVSDFIPGFEQAHEEALRYPFETYIGGHLNRLGTRRDVEVQQQFVRDLKAEAGRALGSVDFNGVAGRVGFSNPWRLFDQYLDEVATECTRAMTPKWTARLGGAEAFMYGHCWTMVEALRIDHGKG
jgi:glyoxylase-like metal-dependent hydrolase (beta-lactamase superfamily II)